MPYKPIIGNEMSIHHAYELFALFCKAGKLSVYTLCFPCNLDQKCPFIKRNLSCLY